MRFLHTVSVQRESRTVATAATTFSGYAQVFASVPCLIEPMGHVRQATILGDMSQSRFHFTWGTEALQDGDLVDWNGAKYILHLGSDDRYRGAASNIEAYQTGYIELALTYRD